MIDLKSKICLFLILTVCFAGCSIKSNQTKNMETNQVIEGVDQKSPEIASTEKTEEDTTSTDFIWEEEDSITIVFEPTYTREIDEKIEPIRNFIFRNASDPFFSQAYEEYQLHKDYLSNNLTDQASAHLLKAYELSLKVAEEKQQIILYHDLFLALLNNHKKNEALDLLRRLTDIVRIPSSEGLVGNLGALYNLYDSIITALIEHHEYDEAIEFGRSAYHYDLKKSRLATIAYYFIDHEMYEKAIKLSKEMDGGYRTNYKNNVLREIAFIYLDQGRIKEADEIVDQTSNGYIHVSYHIQRSKIYLNSNQHIKAREHLYKAYEYYQISIFLDNMRFYSYSYILKEQCVAMEDYELLITLFKDDERMICQAISIVARHQLKKGLKKIPDELVPYFDEEKWEERLENAIEFLNKQPSH